MSKYTDPAKEIPQIWREADDLIIMQVPHMETRDGFSDFSISEEGAARMFSDLAEVLKHKYRITPI